MRIAAVLVALSLFLARSQAQARAIRRVFEPTDLEIEAAGDAELDVQLGAIKGRPPWRVVVPDFELDIGLFQDFEIDVDGALALDGTATSATDVSGLAFDNLWLAGKTGLWSIDASDGGAGFGLGAQLGPKLPTGSGARGIGIEGVLLATVVLGRNHLAFNLGGLVDPAAGSGQSRPAGIEGGIDFARAFGAGGRWSFTGEIGGVRFWSRDPHQLAATAGVACAVRPWLEVSALALAGILDGSDRFGVLLGFSPRVPLFSRRRTTP